MSLVFGLTACGSKSEKPKEPEKKVTDDADKTKKEEPEKKEEPKPYTKGKVEGNHFESEWLNMKADFSDQYVMATAEEIANIQSAGSEELLNEEGQEIIDNAQNVTNEMMAVALGGNPNCTLIVEKLPMENMTEKQYLEITKQSLLNSITDELKIAMRGEMPTVTIAGEDYMCLMADMHMGEVKLKSNTYVRMKDGYAIVFNATFDENTEAQKDEMLATFQPITLVDR